MHHNDDSPAAQSHAEAGHASMHSNAVVQAEGAEATPPLAHAAHSAWDHSVNHNPRQLAQRRLLGAAFGPVAQREPQGLDEELPVQGKTLASQQAVQRAAAKADLTGMPDQLKSGIEVPSGELASGLVVQGLGFGKRQDLAPYARTNDVAINDDPALEHKAEVMGTKALQAYRRPRDDSQALALPASWRSIAQLKDLPPDSAGELKDMPVKKAEKEITALELQKDLIENLSKVGKVGFGYRLVTLLYSDNDFHKDTRESHDEEHGMKPWPDNIDANLADIKLLVRATLQAANQLEYLDKNAEQIAATHEVIVDVDWYRERYAAA